MKRKNTKEKGIQFLLFSAAVISVVCVVFIMIFILWFGLPLFGKINPADFLFSTNWKPSSDTNPGFGIFSFIAGSFYVTFLALLFAVPIGIMCGVFLAEYTKEPFTGFLRRIVELLAGIPSVIFGFFGVMIICKWIRDTFGGTGYSMLAASIVLAIMILPTIITVTDVSIRSLPRSYKEVSFALGATRWDTVIKILIPQALSGISAGIVLAIGRALGETMAVLMVGGNAPIMPSGLLSNVRTMTMNIATDMSYASGDHRTALFTTSIVLFVFILIINLLVQKIIKKSRAI